MISVSNKLLRILFLFVALLSASAGQAQLRAEQAHAPKTESKSEPGELILQIHEILKGNSAYKVSAAINEADHFDFAVNPQLGAETHFAIAAYFSSQQAGRHAAEHYRKGLEYLSATGDSPEKASTRFEMTRALASELEKANRSDSAFRTIQLAIRQAEILNNKVLQGKGYLQLARWSIEHHEPAKAIKYLEIARVTTDSLSKKEVNLQTAIADLMAGNAVDQHKLDELVRQAGADDSSIEFIQFYARHLIAKNFDVKAGELLRKLEKLVNNDPWRRASLNHLKMGYFIALNETDEAKELWMNSPMEFRQLAQKPSTDELWDARLIGPIKAYHAPEPPVNPEVHISPIVIVGGCLVIVLLGILIAVISWPKRKQNQVQSKEVWSLQPAYPLALEGYPPMARVKRVHKSVVEAILKRISGLVGEKPEVVQEELKVLVGQLEEMLNLGREQSTMLANIDQLDDNFTHRLREKYKFLNEKEKRMAELIRLNLTIPEIALILHISEVSVEEQQKNLAQKIALEDDEDLYLFIANI